MTDLKPSDLQEIYGLGRHAARKILSGEVSAKLKHLRAIAAATGRELSWFVS